MDKCMRYLFASISLLVLMTSCGTSKRILSGNRLYAVQTAAIVNQARQVVLEEKLIIYTNKEVVSSNFEDKGSYLQFKSLPTGFVKVKSIDIPISDLNTFAPFKTDGVAIGTSIVSRPFYMKNDLGHFKLDSNDEFSTDENGSTMPVTRGFRFNDGKPVFQAINVTFKFRSKPNLDFPESYATPRRAAIDSFPGQVDAGVNIGFAIGYKFNHNWYKSQKDILGRNTNQVSFTPAILFGTGATDISNSNSRFVPKFVSRKRPLMTFGFIGMIGINNINIGYAAGWDWAQGRYGENWVFQGNLWQGIVVALDIIK